MRTTSPILGAALILAACSSYGDGEPGFYECRHEETPLDDDDAPAPLLDFGASDVLEWAVGSREERARFLPVPANVGTNVAEGEVGLTFSIARGEGDAVQLQRDPACGGSVELRIPARFTLTTDDGALDESVPATLVADGAGRHDRARLEAPLELDDLSGSWELTLGSRLRIVSSGVFIVLAPEGSAGNLGMMLEERSAAAVTLYPGNPLLRWPADGACPPLELPRTLSDDDPEWVAPMASLRSTEWSTVAGVSPARMARVTIEPRGVECEPANGDRYAPFLVRVEMDDDSAPIEVPASVRRSARGLELALALGFAASGSPDEFIARFGDFGLDLSTFPIVTLELSLTVGPSGTTGAFAVVGLSDDCKQVCDSRGCTGCPPYTPHRLLELGLQTP